MRNVVISFALIALLTLSFSSVFTIAVPSQEYSCLYAKYFIVDKTDHSVKRERLIAFNLPVDTPYFHKGTRWIKKLVGMPGDKIIIKSQSVQVNEKKYVNNMNLLLMKLEMDKSKVEREITLKEDEYFVIGETPLSYDSRFWGVINQKDVLGNAYAIL